MVWVWIWKISPKNVKLFNFFPSGQKNLFGLGHKVPGLKAGQPLIYCGSKVSSGKLPKSESAYIAPTEEGWAQKVPGWIKLSGMTSDEKKPRGMRNHGICGLNNPGLGTFTDVIKIIVLASTVLWSEESSQDGSWKNENPVMSFPIKRRINTDLFIDRMAALYLVESWIRHRTNEGDQRVGTSWMEEQAYLEKSGVNLSWDDKNRT